MIENTIICRRYGFIYVMDVFYKKINVSNCLYKAFFRSNNILLLNHVIMNVHMSTLTRTTAPISNQKEYEELLGQWTHADVQCKYFSEKANECRKTRSDIQTRLCEFMERNRLQNQSIRISDGSLHYSIENVKPGLTQKLISEHLPEYFETLDKTTQVITAQEKTELLLKFLNERRVPEQRAFIKRKYTGSNE